MKIRQITHEDGRVQMLYNCPGCGYEHAFSPNVHKFNNDFNSPTVTPSLLNSNPQQYRTCHSFITNGRIQFCEDSWHTLKGQTVDLPDYPEGTVQNTIINPEYGGA